MREAFERAILDNPDDLAHYAACADWLSEQGDPRGEFIGVQLALEDQHRSAADRDQLRRREAQLLDAHRREWLGPLAPALLENRPVMHHETLKTGPNFEYRFARGFLHSLLVRVLSVPFARTLRDAWQTRFLRELAIEGIQSEPDEGDGEAPYEPGDDVPTFEHDNIQFVSIYPLLGTPQFTCLRSFSVGGEIDMDACLHSRYGTSHHAYCNPAADLVERMPRLEELHLLCKDFSIEKLFASRTLTRLRVLRIYHLGAHGADRRERPHYAYPLDVLAANPTFGRLTHLLFHPHHEEYHQETYGKGRLPSFLPLPQVQALVRSSVLTNLTHLQLRLSNMGDDGCRALVESGILRRLKWLDLRHGCVTDAGAHLLAACPDLKHLEFLDVSRNALTADGIAPLRQVCRHLRADAMLTPLELAQEIYLFNGDFE
jgi:uncharacterized protein (TIGR02996 family)